MRVRIVQCSAAALALAAAFAYSLFAQAPTAAQGADISAALAPYVVPPVTLGLRTYEVSGGVVDGGASAVSGPAAQRVLLLAWYATVSDTNPYFSFSGADTDALRANVSALQKYLADLRSMPSFSSTDRQDALSVIHPLAFLSTIADLEDARRELSAHPSYPNALRYHTLLLSSISAYRSDLARLRSEFEQLGTDANLDPLLHFPGRTMRPSWATAFLDTMDAAAAADLAAENARFACLQGGSCASTDLAIAPPHITDFADTTDTAQAVPAAKDLVATLLDSEDIPQEDRFTLIGNTGCFNDGPGASDQVIGWLHPSSSGGAAITFQPLAALAFTPITSDDGKDTTFAALTKAGYDTRLESSGNFYLCPDLSYYLRFATAYAIRNELRQKSLLAPYADAKDPALRTAAALEKRIAASSAISVPDVEAYVAKLSALYATQGERQLANLLAGPADALRARHLLELWRDKSGNLELVLGRGVYQLALFERQQEGVLPGQPQPRTLYLLTARSYPSLYFFGANESIAGEPQAPYSYAASFASTTTVPLSEMSKEYGLSQIETIIRIQHESPWAQ